MIASAPPMKQWRNVRSRAKALGNKGIAEPLKLYGIM